jgi:hypothetical protein
MSDPVPSLPHYARLPGNSPAPEQSHESKMIGPLVKMAKMAGKLKGLKSAIKPALKVPKFKKKEKFY